MRTGYGCVIFILLAFASCDAKRESASGKKKKEDDIVRSYSPNGNLKAEISMKHGLRDGLSKTYYSNGKVSLELTYKEGKRQGRSRRYYESGVLYQETDYENDKMEGLRKKYTEDGKLMSEQRFSNNLPCNRLKEYQDNGKLRVEYPTIIISPTDRIKTDGTYILNLSLSNGNKPVKYYKGILTKEGCLTEEVEPLLTDTKEGKGKILYYLPPGRFLMEEVHIIAEVTTYMGNTYLAQRSFNVSIEN